MPCIIMDTNEYWICRNRGVVYLVDKKLRVFPYNQSILVQVGVWSDENQGKIVLFPGMEDVLKMGNLEDIISTYKLKKSEES
jgi:hypothetical protein